MLVFSQDQFSKFENKNIKNIKNIICNIKI